mgnify:CR=1 FL=1
MDRRRLPRTPEWKAHVSAKLKGRQRTTEEKAKISAALKGQPFKMTKRRRAAYKDQRGKAPWNKGLKLQPLSEEKRKKLSEAHRRNPRPFTKVRRRRISKGLRGRHIGGISHGEHKVRERLRAQGCQVYRAGWPDFLVVEPSGKIHAIEVKRPYGRLSPMQEAVFKLLQQIGLSIEVLHESNERTSPDCPTPSRKH